jgi:hypothetical protein
VSSAAKAIAELVCSAHREHVTGRSPSVALPIRVASPKRSTREQQRHADRSAHGLERFALDDPGLAVGKKRTATTPAACTRSSSAGQSRYWTGFSVATGSSALSAAEDGGVRAFVARGAHRDQAATDRLLLEGGAGVVDAVGRCGVR